MNKAEQRALEAYPDIQQPIWDESYPKVLFTRCAERSAFIQGYHQAEKDLALTWEDMRKIVEITMIIDGEFVESTDGMEAQEYWEETLRRFLEQREKK